jgi:hypothetical protein
MKTQQIKHMTMLVIGGVLALSLAACGKPVGGPYAGHDTHYFVTHKAALNQQLAWCKKHENGTNSNKTCDAVSQALSQLELNTFLAPPTPSQIAAE